jgi:hypothetical protein
MEDLTFASARKEKMKEVVEPNGLKRLVPFSFWRAKVLANPMGETAQLAARNKDSDFKKLKVDEIPLNAFCESGIVDLDDGPKALSPPLVSQPFIGNLTSKKAQDMGFRKAEEGKTGR